MQVSLRRRRCSEEGWSPGPREQVREEPSHVPQEVSLAPHAAQLLEERERQDLQSQEPLDDPTPGPRLR